MVLLDVSLASAGVLQFQFTHSIAIFSDHLWVLFPDVMMVLASEVAVDVVKHAFITKFNDISADVSRSCQINRIFWKYKSHQP